MAGAAMTPVIHLGFGVNSNFDMSARIYEPEACGGALLPLSGGELGFDVNSNFDMSTSIDEPEACGGELRPLSGGEWALFQMSNERQGACRVACCARLHGVPFGLNALQRAIDSVQKRHPLMNAVVGDDGRFHSTSSARAKVTCHERAQADSWQLALGETLFAGAAEINRPLLQVTLVRSTGTSLEQDFELLLAAEHFVCDGRSLPLLVDEVLAEVTQARPTPTGPPLRIPPSIEACMAKQAWKPFSIRSLFIQLLVLVLRPLMLLIAKCLRPIREQQQPRRVAIRRFSATRCQLLLEAARRQQCSLTSTLIATVMAATKKAQHDLGVKSETVACRCPVDLRSRYAQESVSDNEMSYHVGVAQITRRVNLANPHDSNSIADRDLWTMARSIRRELRENADRDAFVSAKLASAGLTRIPVRMNMSSTRPHIAVVSNWGQAQLQSSYGDWRLIEVIPLLNFFPINSRQCLALTVNGQLTLTFGVPDQADPNPEKSAEDFADSVATNLDRMITASSESKAVNGYLSSA